jgi:hypothetical protein
MSDQNDKPWAWAVPYLYTAQRTLEIYGTIPTTALFYTAPGTDPLGGTREESLTQIDGINLSSDEATAQSIELLKRAAFEDAPDSILMIGEGWDFSDDEEAMKQAREGEDVQPTIVTSCVFCTVETPRMYYMSKAEILTDKNGYKTFVVRSLAEFQEVPVASLAGRFARILPFNKLSP